MLEAANQLLACAIRGGPFIFFNTERPNPDETISSWIGRSAEAGYRAGLIAEKVVDFFLGAGHCRLAIGK
jgi:hypothetical protein